MKTNNEYIRLFFNHNNLNKIAKKYKFKKTIIKKHYNKEQIFNFINNKAIIIQSYVRCYLAKLYYKHLLNCVKHESIKYINESSIIGQSLESIESIYFINISNEVSDNSLL